MYELVLYDRLVDAERATLAPMTRDASFYGVLRARLPSTLRVKSVCRETALLFLSMQQPGAVPRYVLATDDGLDAVATLVLDGVLEVLVGDSYLSGPHAHSYVLEPMRGSSTGSAIAALSREALAYAEALELEDASVLAAKLYAYNRVPFGPSLARRVADPGDVLRALGLDEGGEARRRFSSGWSYGGIASGWSVWVGPQSHGPSAVHKLYVSPRPEHVPATLLRMADVLRSAAPTLKIGITPSSLTRPDKIVVYFSAPSALDEAVEALLPAFGDLGAQGVPFTTERGHAGLLSSAVDPPIEEQTSLWQAGESWRTWITNLLGAALATARTSGAHDVAPSVFALDRLRLAGIDPVTFTGANARWYEARAEA